MEMQPQTATSHPAANKKKQTYDAPAQCIKPRNPPEPTCTQLHEHHYAMQTLRTSIGLGRLLWLGRLQGLLWRRVEDAGGVDQSGMRVQLKAKARTIEGFDVEIALCGNGLVGEATAGQKTFSRAQMLTLTGYRIRAKRICHLASLPSTLGKASSLGRRQSGRSTARWRGAQQGCHTQQPWPRS